MNSPDLPRGSPKARERVAAAVLLSPLAALLGAAVAESPRGTVLALGAGAALITTVVRPIVVVVLFVASLPWDGYLQLPVAGLTVNHLLGLLLVAGTIFRLTTSGERLRLPSMSLWVLAVLAAMFVSTVFSSDPVTGLHQLGRTLLFAASYFALLQFVRDSEETLLVLRTLTISATLAAATGIALFASGAVNRAHGPIGDPNDFGFLLAVVVPGAFVCWQQAHRARALWFLQALVVTAGALATLSRGAVVGLAAALVVALANGTLRPRLTVRDTVVLVVLGAAVWTVAHPLIEHKVAQRSLYNSAATNVTDRKQLWSAALRMTLDRPIVGIGPGRFPAELPAYLRGIGSNAGQLQVVHNTYLELASEAGLLCLAAFLGFLVSAAVSLQRTARAARAAGEVGLRQLAQTVQLMLVIAAVAGFFISAEFNTPFWVIGALAPAVQLRRQSVVRGPSWA